MTTPTPIPVDTPERLKQVEEFADSLKGYNGNRTYTGDLIRALVEALRKERARR